MMQAFLSTREVQFIGKMNNQLVYVRERDIAYVHIKHGIVWATNRTGGEIPIDITLDEVESALDTRFFFWVNR